MQLTKHKRVICDIALRVCLVQDADCDFQHFGKDSLSRSFYNVVIES